MKPYVNEKSVKQALLGVIHHLVGEAREWAIKTGHAKGWCVEQATEEAEKRAKKHLIQALSRFDLHHPSFTAITQISRNTAWWGRQLTEHQGFLQISGYNCGLNEFEARYQNPTSFPQPSPAMNQEIVTAIQTYFSVGIHSKPYHFDSTKHYTEKFIRHIGAHHRRYSYEVLRNCLRKVGFNNHGLYQVSNTGSSDRSSVWTTSNTPLPVGTPVIVGIDKVGVVERASRAMSRLSVTADELLQKYTF